MQVLTAPNKAEKGTQVRIWRDPLTMRRLKMVAELVEKRGERPFTIECERQVWIVKGLDGCLSCEEILVSTRDGSVVTPEMLERWT